jgi:two-component system, NarL family, sensor histidine kinase DesK
VRKPFSTLPSNRGLFSRIPEDRWQHGRRNGRGVAGVIWAAFILFPLVNALTTKDSASGRVLTVAGAVIFTAAYVWGVLIMFEPGQSAKRFALTGTLVAVAIALTLHEPDQWWFLFTYCAACLALVTPIDRGIPAILGLTAVAVGVTALAGGAGGQVISAATTTVAIGLLMVLMHNLRERNQELCEARSELARTAVAAERERFARDLHDLLGHSLSVIAIKAELAGRLLPTDAERAGREVADVEQVARQALSEVRQAVSEYRKPTLDGELEGARMALTAAGIDAEFERAPAALDPEVEAVLAWTVREGATNVIRHSGARHCQVRVRMGDGDAGVEVLDDGLGQELDVATNGHVGNGIAGLRARAEHLTGRIEAGRRADGAGFRLAVSVPMTAVRPS